jgi:hypothetical protein
MQCSNCPIKYSIQNPTCSCRLIQPTNLISVNCDAYWIDFGWSYGLNYTCQVIFNSSFKILYILI